MTCANGCSITIKINNVNGISGDQYNIALLLTDGTKITYVATATPGGHSGDSNPNPNNVPSVLSVPSPSPPPSPIAMFVTDNPLIVASLVAVAEIVAGAGILVYIIRKHVDYVDDYIVVAICLIIVAAITLFLVCENPNPPPPPFSLYLGF